MGCEVGRLYTHSSAVCQPDEYANIDALLEREAAGGRKTASPGPGDKPQRNARESRTSWTAWLPTDVERILTNWRWHVDRNEFPAPQTGFVLTHFLVVSDQDRSRDFYQSLFDAKVLRERDPVIMKVANSWLILNVGGGPTDDKPTVTLTAPPDPNRRSAPTSATPTVT